METVQFNKNLNDNPFNGMPNCLKLLQAATENITPNLIDLAYGECCKKEDKEMFYSILFSIGDVTNRQHNIFRIKNVDGGGFSNREGFHTIIEWMWRKDKKQFAKFLEAGLFNEYSCFDILFRNRVKTKGAKILSVYTYLEDKQFFELLLAYTYKVVNSSNPFNKLLVAKFLTIPRLSKRQGHKKMLPETRRIMELKANFITRLSNMLGWDANYFKGYREWRKLYNGSLESVLFSTGKINEFTKDEFIDWFGKLPAQARFRVKNRILYSEKEIEHPDNGKVSAFKWAKFQPWIKEWETYKEKKQQEQRDLEEKIRQGQADENDKAKLEKVKKEAKVTTGATNFKQLYEDIMYNRVDKLKLESFINKVNLPYNSLVIIDDSGSMSGAPFNFASFIASVCLVKNPDDDARNLIGMFNTHTHWHSFIDELSSSRNSYLRTKVAAQKSTPLVDPKLSFYDNYKKISSFLMAKFQGGGTRISYIPDGLNEVCIENPEVLDALKSYPIWTIISDGEWNCMSSPQSSIRAFFDKCERYFGFKPFIVAIDICEGRYRADYLKADHFSGIENMIYIPSNPAMIEQFLTNFKDMEFIDVYLPLQSLWRSNRYTLVRENVIG